MANYDFTGCLSSLDFELLSKDLLEAELGIQLENFSEGRDAGIDLRYAPLCSAGHLVFNLASFTGRQTPPELIVQCKRYSKFSDLKSTLKNKELSKIQKLKPARYILTTSVPLSPQQAKEIKTILSPFVQSTGDIYGRERLNALLGKHQEIERRNIKLWITSAGVLDTIINAGTHLVSREEVERTVAAAKIYVQNPSFAEALAILKKHRVCIISGLPGIGKTTLARMLLLYFYDKKFDVVKISEDISEAQAFDYHNRPRCYFYDDFLGQTAQADKLNKNEDQRLLDFMASVRDSRKSVFVLTTREYILNQARQRYERLAREKFDHRMCIIDISKYSRRIRAQILYNHLHFSKLLRAHLKALVAKRGYVKIVDHRNYNPRLIEYLTDLVWVGETRPADYLPLFLRKLDNPADIWEHAFRNQLSDKARNLLFVLTTMPTEVRIDDLAAAFATFHNSQCAKFTIPHSANDFIHAIKELDGTFVATRKIQESMLVRFQNPSIRDFMQRLLLEGESLDDLIVSLAFFEQAQWVAEKLNEENLMPRFYELSRQAGKIVGALQRLIETDSCLIFAMNYQSQAQLSVLKANPAVRLAFTATLLSKQEGQEGADWISTKILEITTDLEDGRLSPASVIGSIKVFAQLGLTNSIPGKQLVGVLKVQTMEELDNLDAFESLAKLFSALPQSFSDTELETIRATYGEFIDRYADTCDSNNPDELREEASRIGTVGDLLQVDTDSAQDSIREYADAIEETERSDWEDDDRGGGGGSDECSDRELDAMFGTLVS